MASEAIDARQREVGYVVGRDDHVRLALDAVLPELARLLRERWPDGPVAFDSLWRDGLHLPVAGTAGDSAGD